MRKHFVQPLDAAFVTNIVDMDEYSEIIRIFTILDSSVKGRRRAVCSLPRDSLVQPRQEETCQHLNAKVQQIAEIFTVPSQRSQKPGKSDLRPACVSDNSFGVTALSIAL